MKRKIKTTAAKTPDDVITSPDNAAPGSITKLQRQGPRPLNMHLYTTAFLLSAAAWPWAKEPEYRDRLMEVLATLSDDMKRGLDDYRAARHVAIRTQQQPIWQDGSSTLLRYPQKNADKKIPVLLVPSLINRADILDLDEGHSFTRFLVGQGFDVHTLDWGTPQETEKAFSIDDYITARLIPALKILQQRTGQAAHIIGYCMGGTIAAGAIATLKKQEALVRSLTMLAAPWDFHAGDETVKLRMNAYLANAGGVMEAKGVLPVDWIQMLFASIDPLFAFNKFRAFAAMDKDSDEARRFVIVEDWLNDGVDLVAPSAYQALQQWYIDNQPVNGVWTIGSALVDTANIQVPVLVVAATGDRLVPEASARAFMQGTKKVKTLSPEIGHIGMMASTRARELVWEPVAGWLARQ